MQAKTKKTLVLSAVILISVSAIAGLLFVNMGNVFRWVGMSGDAVQLKGSGVENKYLYSHQGNIRFMDMPAYPVYVSVIKIPKSPGDQSPERTFAVESGEQYSVDLSLGPGEYQIVSSVAPQLSCCSDDEYWSASGPKIMIRKDGMSKTEKRTLVHRLKMTVLDPPNKATVREKRPSLQWLPVKAAKYYGVRWSCDRPGCSKHDIKATDFQYAFAEDVQRGAAYRWDVSAFNGEGEEIAYSAESSFDTVK